MQFVLLQVGDIGWLWHSNWAHYLGPASPRFDTPIMSICCSALEQDTSSLPAPWVLTQLPAAPHKSNEGKYDITELLCIKVNFVDSSPVSSVWRTLLCGVVRMNSLVAVIQPQHPPDSAPAVWTVFAMSFQDLLHRTHKILNKLLTGRAAELKPGCNQKASKLTMPRMQEKTADIGRLFTVWLFSCCSFLSCRT